MPTSRGSMSRRGSIPDIADSVDATRPFCLGSSAHTTISFRQVPAAAFPAAARAFGGTAASEPRPLGAARNHCPFGLQMLQPGRAGQRGMAGCGPGRCAVTLTAASRICSAAVLAWPVRRAKRLRASRHAVEDHGPVTGEDFRGPPQPRARRVRQRTGDVTSPPPECSRIGMWYALTTCAGPAAMC